MNPVEKDLLDFYLIDKIWIKAYHCSLQRYEKYEQIRIQIYIILIANPKRFLYVVNKMESQKYNLFADVVFPIPVEHAFTYAVPPHLAESLQIGMRIFAPFGHRRTTGFVVGLKAETELTDIKEIDDVLDQKPLFSQDLLELSRWIAEYYICGWGEVLKAALPSGIHRESEKVVRLVHPEPEKLAATLQKRAPRQAAIINALSHEGVLIYKKLSKQLGVSSLHASLNSLKQAGHVRIELALPEPKVKIKQEYFVRLLQEKSKKEIEEGLNDLRKQALKQARCLELLLACPDGEMRQAELLSRAQANSGSIKSLARLGLVQLFVKTVFRDYFGGRSPEPAPNIIPNADQQAVLEKINQAVADNQFSTFLLHGVTASGKTQVYIEAIYKILELGKTAIVLVPEIALTPQMVSRFRSHFGEKVAVHHSRMSVGEKYDSWRSTWEGERQIVIGPRSAIFAPLKNIGLIVVDEEHEWSYKQVDPPPRYHARDVAVMRGKLNNAVVLLGSATPSCESYFNASVGKYQLLTLPNRIDNVPMPEVEIVDMRKEPRAEGQGERPVFSRLLRSKIDEKLSRGEQIILLQNRRGFSTFVQCKHCGYTEKCENCDITLTYHLRGNRLRCHYCNFSKPAPDVCPDCGGIDIFFKGIGTQKVEEEISRIFPGIRAIRMDLDTTHGKWAHDRILSSFGRGEYDVLLGTQMVAKGLDFPRVTLVGVISADTELLMPDFRSAERTFQLVTQVAGRSGRKDRKGEVIVQTYSPDAYSLIYAKRHDFENFFKREMRDRRLLHYPPYSRLVNVLIRGTREEVVSRTAQRLAAFVENRGDFQMLGPAPSPLSKIQKNYRWQLIFKTHKKKDAGGKAIKKAIGAAIASFKTKHRFRNVHAAVDVDPVSLL